MAFPNYHTQHAPLGAFASFTVGLHRGTGGFGQSLSGPAQQSVYVGCRAPGSRGWRLLPFLPAPPASNEVLFTGDTAHGPTGVPVEREIVEPADYRRELGWASDRWQLDRLTFTVFTGWTRTRDPDTMSRATARQAFAPVVCALLEYDNRAGTAPAELVFGLHQPAQPQRPLTDTDPRLVGFATGGAYGFATSPSHDVEPRQGFDILMPKTRDHRGLHLLGQDAGLVFRVPAGKKRAYPLALGFFHAGPATVGLDTQYYYTRLFAGLEDVLAHGLAEHAAYRRLAAARDRELARAPLSSEQKWLIAQATHSYFGSTQLLVHRGRALWAVNEGEYRMLNTFDLTVDHLFFELEWHPWAVRNTLDLFVARYSYRDSIHTPDGRRGRGGISFTHDMGVANQFTPAGHSAYECRDLNACFSQMTMEQLLNWICCAVAYGEKTGDTPWLRRRQAVLAACFESILQRDDPDPDRRTGIMKWDSDRCGPHGSEITTYDSLDASLGQARNNLYVATKTLAACLLLERAFTTLRKPSLAAAARAAAGRSATAIETNFDGEARCFPAVFERGNRSRILPAVEGLVFPLYLGFAQVVKRRFPTLMAKLRDHLTHALQPGVCLDAKSGVWKISSTSHNTWLSKIALAQHVVRSLFPEALNPAARAADAAHARVQQSPPVGRFACVDQFNSETGADLGSRYYPRAVTACLWFRERPRRRG